MGGVLGGISGLLGTIGGIWAWMKRRARHAVASAAPTTPSPDPEKPPVQSPGVDTIQPMEYFPTTLSANAGPPPRLYVYCLLSLCMMLAHVDALSRRTQTTRRRSQMHRRSPTLHLAPTLCTHLPHPLYYHKLSLRILPLQTRLLVDIHQRNTESSDALRRLTYYVRLSSIRSQLFVLTNALEHVVYGRPVLQCPLYSINVSKNRAQLFAICSYPA